MLALLIVPIIEVYIIIQVGHAIGGWNTLGLLIIWSAIGAWIVKREAKAAFSGLRDAFRTGRMPTHELADAALVLIGGTLLLAPGFLTDFIGLFFLIPFTRPLTRRILERAVAARLFGNIGVVAVSSMSRGGGGRTTRTSSIRGFSAGSPSGGSAGATEPPPYPAGYPTDPAMRRAPRRGDDDVIEGEIID